MPELPQLANWTEGENNKLRADELPVNTLRRCINYDISDGGRLVRRKGYQRVIAGDVLPGSLFSAGEHTLCVIDNDLCAIDAANWSTRVIRAGIGRTPICYLALHNQVYWNNGAEIGIVDTQGQHLAWGVSAPATQPRPTGASVGGQLPAGTYQIALTHLSATGEESGTGVAAIVGVGGTGQGSIDIDSFPPAPEGVVLRRLYVSSHNGEQLYHLTDLLPGTRSHRITAIANQLGHQLDSQFADVPPGGHAMAHHNGQIFIADGNAVWMTDPLRYGLVRQHTGFLLFGAPVTLLASVADGLYVCADKTYWLSEFGTSGFSQREVLPYGAVSGTAANIPLSDNVAWFSRHGLVIAGLQGQVVSVQEDRSAVGEFERGAMLFREQDGLRQIICSLGGGSESPLLATDYRQLEIARKGNAL